MIWVKTNSNVSCFNVMKTVIHKANTRGHFDHGWLKTYHTFSFADYYDPARMNFGALRVLNDDYIAPSSGFPMHPHRNMEIITIPLEGELEHEDSMGNKGVLKHGEIQVMSAGKGIMHSEYNRDSRIPLKLLQIWVISDKMNVEPRYEQHPVDLSKSHNSFHQIASPDKDQGAWIHQQAWFSIGQFDKGTEKRYDLKSPHNGVYAFVIEGSFEIGGIHLSKRDGLGIFEAAGINTRSEEDNSVVIFMEVPMI